MTAADFYSSQGFFEKAINAYRHFIEKAEGRYDTHRQYDREEPVARALYKLAAIYEQLCDYRNAASTLKQARHLYSDNLDDSQLIEIERTPIFFPTVSDIDLKLGEISQKLSDLDECVLHFKSAITRIEEALGPSSAYLRKPLLGLIDAYRSKNECLLADQLEQRLLTLQRLDETPDAPTRQEIHQSASQAFQAVKAYDHVTAGRAIARLLDIYNSLLRLPDAYEVRRQRWHLWSCLLNLSELYIRQERFDNAGVLLEQLLTTARQLQQPDSNLLSVLTERVLFADRMGLSFGNCWGELLDAVAKSLPLTRQESPARLNDPQGENLLIAERLRRLALAYSSRGEYERAEVIFHRAHLLLSTSKEPHQLVEAADISTTLQADRAICALGLGYYERATDLTRILNPLADKLRVGSKVVKKLALIAHVFAQTGHQADAEELLERAIERKNYAPLAAREEIVIPGYLQWKLALLLRNKGDLDRALRLTKICLEQYQTSRCAVPKALLIFLAEICSTSGDYAEAARQ
jgi:tetratricopeptide (TPR) repeat protein